MRTCPKCKKTIENDKALFCRYCGHELSVPVGPPPVPKPEPEPESKPEPIAPPPAPESKPEPAEEPVVGAYDYSDDDVDVEVVSTPSIHEDDGVDLLDVPTGISTYTDEDEPEPKNLKPEDVGDKPVDVDDKPMVFGGIPVMVEDEPAHVEEKPAEVEPRREEPVVQQSQSEGKSLMPIYYIIGFCVLVIAVALIVNYALHNNSSSYESPISSNDVEYSADNPSTYPSDQASEASAPASESNEDSRQQALQKFCGSFTLTEKGGGFNVVTELVLDPVNRSCRKVIDDGAGGYIVNITNSIGYYGSEMQMVAYWNILSFNISEDGRSALIEMIPEFGDEVAEVSKVKLQLDEYNNITLSHVSGNSSPVSDGHRKEYFTRD